MVEIKKLTITNNPSNDFEIYMNLLDDNDQEIIKINIEVLTADIIKSEINNMGRYKKSIWEVVSDLIKEKEPIKYVIETEKNKEYFGYFYFNKTDEKLFMRPSDGMITSFIIDIPIYIENSLLDSNLIKTKNETIEDINEQIKKAISEENYDLAAELKQKRDQK